MSAAREWTAGPVDSLTRSLFAAGADSAVRARLRSLATLTMPVGTDTAFHAGLLALYPAPDAEELPALQRRAALLWFADSLRPARMTAYLAGELSLRVAARAVDRAERTEDRARRCALVQEASVAKALAVRSLPAAGVSPANLGELMDVAIRLTPRLGRLAQACSAKHRAPAA